jgi:peptidoglycan hydrolase-like protein with peptidoglycan-binding domain
MTIIRRDDFVNLSRSGGFIDVDHMSQDLKNAFKAYDIKEQELLTIAGGDHVIRGRAEFQNLFARLDKIDADGNPTTLTTTDGAGRQTASGRVVEALRTEVEANRARVARAGGLRFASDPTLQRVMRGEGSLELGSRGDSVRILQQALIDVGALYPTHGVTSVFDAATQNAVRHFQLDVGLGSDGAVGADTLSALASCAPAPGQKIERSPEYSRLYADGRLDVTIAVGFDDHGANADTERRLLSGLRTQGYQPITTGGQSWADLTNPNATHNAQRPYLSVADATRLGLTRDRYDPNALYFSKTFKDPANPRQDVTAVVRFITPGTDGARARASFEQAMQQDEVVMYNGHARYGTGPDFDSMASGAGNFVVDPHGNRTFDTPPTGLRNSIRGRQSDLAHLSQRPDYQLLIFDGCHTEEYLQNIRDPSVFQGRSMVNTDVIATDAMPAFMWSGQPALRFLEGITSRESNNSMIRDQVRLEQAHLRAINDQATLPDAEHTFMENGFLGNHDNQVVPADRP